MVNAYSLLNTNKRCLYLQKVFYFEFLNLSGVGDKIVGMNELTKETVCNGNTERRFFAPGK